MSADTDWTVEQVLAEFGADDRAAQPTNSWAAWVGWSWRVNQKLAAQKTTLGNLTESLRHQLAKQRSEIADLKRELQHVREQLDTQARLTELQVRLDKIEGGSPSRGAGLRAVAT